MRILGLEGTAWAASAAVYDDEDGSLVMETDPFRPSSGGIDPSAAAAHMESALPTVLDALGTELEVPPDAVAFSRGPGLGPCLRLTASAARSVAGTYEVPLIGVNHMVAHAEVGRVLGDATDPIALNASGANAHVLGYRNGRYRVLGETMDTGVGNAIDKFTRHLGWQHPGGPKVERQAREGEYVELPYVVKGMDFSFSGLTSAAKAAVDDGAAIEDVCCGLQETIFAMLTEVTERALAVTHRDELVVGGGVAQNARLQEMLSTMAETRGATVSVPPSRYLRDNAGMIAITGVEMLTADRTIAIEASRVDPEFRPDDVPVDWRTEPARRSPSSGGTHRGAEATIDRPAEGLVRKRRHPKSYRHEDLDGTLQRDRTLTEARLLQRARKVGVPTPVVRDVDPAQGTILMTSVGADDLRERLTEDRVERVGELLATLHVEARTAHGDPTIRNVRVDTDGVFLIDFGLGFRTDDIEDFAMDLHVFLQSLRDVESDADPYRDRILAGYASIGNDTVREQLDAIEGRGRYR